MTNPTFLPRRLLLQPPGGVLPRQNTESGLLFPSKYAMIELYIGLPFFRSILLVWEYRHKEACKL